MRRTGEPRSVTDPANQPFLDAVVRGECPAELDSAGREDVRVNLLRRGTPLLVLTYPLAAITSDQLKVRVTAATEAPDSCEPVCELNVPGTAGEHYTPPERPRYTAFAGRGRTLTGAACYLQPLSVSGIGAAPAALVHAQLKAREDQQKRCAACPSCHSSLSLALIHICTA